MQRNESSFSKDIPQTTQPPQQSQATEFNKQDLIRDLNKNTDLITSLIHQYLLKKEYLKTLDSFQEEISTKLRMKNYYKPNFIDITENSLIKNLTTGNKTEFFKQWNRIIPNHIKMRESTIEKLEFNIQIYFAIYPILYQKATYNKNQLNLKQSMNEFKNFLEKRQTELSKNPEFLSYYALPYIPNPQVHPSYMKLFLPEWTGELKDKIRTCVKKYLPDIKYPILYEMLNNDNLNNNNNLNASNINNNNVNSNMMKTFLESLSKKNYFDEGNFNEDDENDLNNSNIMKKNIMKTNAAISMNPILNNNEEYRKLKEDYLKLKQKDDRYKMNFIDSQRSWCNLTLNILTYSFDLVMLCKSNKSKNDILLKTEKINKKLQKYQAFLNNNINNLENNNFTQLNNINFNNNNSLNNSKNFINMNNNEMNVLDSIGNSKYEDISMINNNIMNNNMSNNNLLNNINMNNNSNNMNLMNNSNMNLNSKSFHNEIESTHLIDLVNLITQLKSIFDWNKNEKNDNEKIVKFDEKLSYIIRELRLRIFRRNDKHLKILTLYSLFYHDLFFKNNMIHNLFNNSQTFPSITLEVSKLLNHLSNLIKGRNYLLMNKSSNAQSLISDIITAIQNEKSDTETRQNLLGSIQKFTIRQYPQNKLLNLNIVTILVDIFIFESKYLSEYTIEYGLALIMNLSMKKEGRKKFEELNEKVIQILLNYFDSDNLSIQTCVNGTLYSLLKRKKFVEVAKKFNLENLIKNKLNNPNNNYSNSAMDQQLRKQMAFILEEINSNNNEEDDMEVDENLDEDPTAIEDDDNNLVSDDYVEADSIDDELIKKHYKFLTEFIIRSEEFNFEEEQKIDKFIRNNPTMINGDYKANNSSDIMENINENPNENEETAKANNITNNNVNKKSDNNNDNTKNNKDNSNENKDKNNLDKDIDIAEAFEKKDKIPRTPPG